MDDCSNPRASQQIQSVLKKDLGSQSNRHAVSPNERHSAIGVQPPVKSPFLKAAG
jgi:hypothetical protein